MNHFKFLIPLDLSKDYQNITVLTNLITYLRIILNRIDENKIKLLEENKFLQPLIDTIALDIKSLYIFAKIYFDYFIRYITLTFLPKNIGIKSKSFNAHIFSFKTIQSDELWLEQYKNLVFIYKRKFNFRIRDIRDKLITHRKLNVNEFWGFDEQNKKFYIYFEKVSDPINIEESLKTKIFDLGKKYGIELSHDKKLISDYVYLDSILTRLETTDKKMDEEDGISIGNLRDKLGIIFNEENIIQQLEDFTEGVSVILKKK